ncbi:MAG: type 1 periplasmic binding fold superfamily protein [bacterium]|nr:type 1 periplasmic binding fold superfamily protein [bacterium]
MKTQVKAIAVLGLALVAGLSSCKKDEDLVPTPPPTENEGEVITTMTLTFVDDAGVQPTVTATFRDPDGEGGLAPDIFDTIRLQNNTVYNCSITLTNETLTPAEDITAEVLAEAVDHIFCFSPSGADVSIVRTDSDGTFEIGIESQWTAGAAGNGTTTVSLKHQPGTKDGTCVPGETDIEVNFVTEVQ